MKQGGVGRVLCIQRIREGLGRPNLILLLIGGRVSGSTTAIEAGEFFDKSMRLFLTKASAILELSKAKSRTYFDGAAI